MAQERLSSVSPENPSVLNSRLFRAGLLFTALGGLYGAVTGKWGFAVTGVILTGAAWATFSLHERGRRKK